MTIADIENVEFTGEFYEQFRPFGAYANITRGTPDVLDGLKPVHRRILWAMYGMGAVPGKKTFKSAKCVGQVMGYHPHGDSAIYDTMTGMAHVPDEGLPFKRAVPLIHGQGAWGDLYDKNAAASRYTECRLSPEALALLGQDNDILGTTVSEIKENGVDLFPNFDGQEVEPMVLPSLWPAFLVNSSKGIGVGIACNTASHNLREVMNLAIYMIDTPTPRMSKILEIMPGPDMPCDADIYDNEGNGIERYYNEGLGSFVMRARVTVEEYKITAKKKGHQIIVHGTPYQVAAEHVNEGVMGMINGGYLPPEVTVGNFSSMKSGTRVVIDVKENDPQDVLQRLFYYGSRSRMQESFSVNSNAIVDGQVRTVGTIEALRKWVDHRRVVVRRRSRFRMERAQGRLEIVEGFLKAIPIAEKIVELVRASAGRAEAELALQGQEWGFSERQASAILDMTLAQLTRLTTDRYLEEKATLEALISECNELITNPKALDTRLKKEMRAVRDKYGYDRRCEIKTGSSQVDAPTEPAVEIPVVNGYLVRTATNWIRWATRANVKPIVGSDYVVEKTRVTDANRIEAISNQGWHYRMFLSDIPEKMTKADALFPFGPGEKVVFTGSSAPLGEDVSFILVAQSPGEAPLVKKIAWNDWATLRAGKNRPVFPLGEGWEITHAFFLPAEGHDITLITSYGHMLKIDSDGIAFKGRSAQGNPVMRLQTNDGEDRIVWAGATQEDDQLTYWTTTNQVGWFNTGKVDYGNRNTLGKLISKSSSLIKGVVKGDGDQLRYFDGSTEEPYSVTLEGQPASTGLNDSKLIVSAPGIQKANAIWIESSSPAAE